MPSSEVSTCIALPFDVIEMIIDLLAENDRNSLKATSLVSLSVPPRCRKHLFSSIKIDENPKSKEKGLALFSLQTDIPKYIRRLEYHWHRNSSSTIRPQLLERISYLQSLHLRYSDISAAFDWIHYIDPSLWSTLVNIMHLPTLTHFHLDYIKNFPLFILFSCMTLKHLQLEYVTVTDECTLLPSGSDIFTVPKILEYTVRRSDATTMKLLTTKLVDGTSALNFTNLQRLSVEFRTNEDVETTRSLLKESKQLEELRVKVADHNPASLSGLADMAFHTYGTSLCVSLCAEDFKTPRGIFSGLCNELSAMSTANNTLKTLRIEINADALEISSSGAWERLDAVLSGPNPGWSCLENISIDITTWDYREN